MEDSEESVIAGRSEAEEAPGDAFTASQFPERDRWLGTMADLSAQHERDFRLLRLRIDRLEKRAALLTMNEEMKTFLVMTGISIAAAVLVPLIQTLVEKWRRSQS